MPHESLAAASVSAVPSRSTPPPLATAVTTHRRMEYSRAAMAINNIGVSLLERRKYREAIMTFHDAIQILKVGMQAVSKCCSGVTRSDRPSHSPTCHNAQQVWERASKRLLLQETARPPSRRKHAGSPIRLEVCSVGDLAGAARDAMEEGPTANKAFVVRFEDMDLPLHGCGIDSCLFLESDLRSAIILHNYAVSYLCQSAGCWTSSPSQIDKRDNLVRTAVKIFTASHCVLVARQKHCVDRESSSILHFIEAIVLCNLAQLSCSSALVDRTRASRCYYEKFVDLRGIILEELSHFGHQPQRVHMAAAA